MIEAGRAALTQVRALGDADRTSDEVRAVLTAALAVEEPRRATDAPAAAQDAARPWTLSATYDSPGLASYRQDKNWFRVKAEGLEFDCLTRLKPGSDRLLIILNGAVARSIHPLPQFARWNWESMLNSNLLCVSDPTLTFHDDMPLGWFVGRRRSDAVEGLVRIARAAATRMRVGLERTVFYGSSGGGFAAIQAAARLPAGRAVAINPQTDIAAYGLGKRLLAEVFDPDASFETSYSRHPERFNATLAFERARAEGRSPRLLLVQNLEDVAHHGSHYTPFACRFGASLAGGVNADGSVRTLIYNGPMSHGPESRAVAKEIATSGLDWLLALAAPA